MNVILLLQTVLGLSFIFSGSMTQSPITREEIVQREIVWLTKDLNLAKNQVEPVTKICRKYTELFESSFKVYQSNPGLLYKVLDEIESYKKQEMKIVLTAAQYNMYEKILKKRKN